jgi:hypothetical protein
MFLHRRAETHVIQLESNRTQAGFDVAQALAVGQSGKGHREKLLQQESVLV